MTNIYMDPNDEWISKIQPYVSGDPRMSALSWAQDNSDYNSDIAQLRRAGVGDRTPQAKYTGLIYAKWLGDPDAEDAYNKLIGKPTKPAPKVEEQKPVEPPVQPYVPKYDPIPPTNASGMLKDLSSIPQGGYGGLLPGASQFAWGGDAGGLLNHPITSTPNFLNYQNNPAMNNFVNSFQSAWQPKVY